MHPNRINRQASLPAMWENIFSVERTLLKNFIVAVAMALIGFSLIYILYNFTGHYFSSVIEITIIAIVFYSGFYIGLSFAILLTIVVDYLYIPPIGSIFKSFAGNERFIIIISITIFAASLASSLKSAFQKVALAKKEAELATSMMEKVLAVVVHDIRNPLTSIKLGARLILKSPEQLDKHQIVLNRIIKTVDHADSMIKSLLDTASIKAGKKISLVFQNCDLNNQIAKMVGEISLIVSDSLRYIPSEPVWGEWGVNGINRALENLITNAIKYGEPNAPIVVKLHKDGQQALLSVHNNGNEISLKDQSKLFDTFHRTQDAESGKVKGWGLGLSVVKSVAEGHGGIVQVESGKGQGTTFTLKIPIRNQNHITTE
jgi:signal transduction histidine kinase